MFLAASLSSVMSVGASPFEEEESSRPSSSSHTGADEKRKATGLGEDTKTTKKSRGKASDTKKVTSETLLAVAGEVMRDPSLGDLVALPKEVLGFVFSKLENPLLMRQVSKATRHIIDTQLAFPVHITKIDRYLKGPEGNRDFAVGRPVALVGVAINLKKEKERFPQGTIFRGGQLAFFGEDELSELPEGARAFVHVDEAAQAKALLARTSGRRISAAPLEKLLEGHWQRYLQTKAVKSLNEDQLQILMNNKKRLIFLTGLKNGVQYLDWFVQAAILIRRFDAAAGAPMDANRSFELFDRLGTGTEKYKIFSVLKQDLFGTWLSCDFGFDTVMNSLASLPDHKTRMYVASNLGHTMVWSDYDFYMGEPSGFKQLVDFLAADVSGKRAAWLPSMNMPYSYAHYGVGVTFTLADILSKVERTEVARDVYRCLNKKIIEAYWTGARIGERRFDQESFEAMVLGLADLPSQQLRHAVLALAFGEKRTRKVIPHPLLDELTHIFKSQPLQQPQRGIDKPRLRKAWSLGIQILRCWTSLQTEGRSHDSVAHSLRTFVNAFTQADLMGEMGLQESSSKIHVDALLEAVREVENANTSRRGMIIDLITRTLVDLTYDPEKKAPDGKLCVDLAKALLNGEQEEITEHLAVHELTKPFVRFFSEEPQMLTDAVAALAKIKDPKIRQGAMNEAAQAFAPDPGGREKALLFLREFSQTTQAL
jgi:hypothetical protein